MNDSTSPTTPALDSLLEILSDRRRRSVLRHLRDACGEVALATLVETVRAAGDDTPDRERIVVGLHHVHLPKLEAAGLVVYDRERRRVAFVGEGDVERLLDVLADYESSAPADDGTGSAGR